MTIHKEGYKTIALTTIAWLIPNAIVLKITEDIFGCWCNPIFLSASILSGIVLIFTISFFRIPSRKLTIDEKFITSPCDGKVVVIEEVFDEEYFKEKRLQVSIFMSPLNVHVNRNPISGEVVYSKYHNGKYLVAWNPKSSTENERHSVVLKKGNKEILVKQIAGAVAKRIVNYCVVGQQVKQGEELGFIKFGSRVDLLLPIGTKINVSMNEVVKGGVTVIGEL